MRAVHKEIRHNYVSTDECEWISSVASSLPREVSAPAVQEMIPAYLQRPRGARNCLVTNPVNTEPLTKSELPKRSCSGSARSSSDTSQLTSITQRMIDLEAAEVPAAVPLPAASLHQLGAQAQLPESFHRRDRSKAANRHTQYEREAAEKRKQKILSDWHAVSQHYRRVIDGIFDSGSPRPTSTSPEWL